MDVEGEFAAVSEGSGVDTCGQDDHLDLGGDGGKVHEEAFVWSGFGVAAAEVADGTIGGFLLVVENEVFVGADFLVGAEKQGCGVDSGCRVFPRDQDLDLFDVVRK